jgi:hypothetical protein
MALFGFGCSLCVVLLILVVLSFVYNRMVYNEIFQDIGRLRRGTLLMWQQTHPQQKKEGFDNYVSRYQCAKQTCQYPTMNWIEPSGQLESTMIQQQYYPRAERCDNLPLKQCVTTPRCGWLSQQRVDGSWHGRCYPGTTEGPRDPLKSQNPEERELWIYAQPNPFL